MSHKNRLTQLEKRANEQPAQAVKVVEVYGTREDGTRYLIETWPQLIACTSQLTDQDGQPLEVNHERGLTTFAEAVREITGNEQP